MRRSAIGEGVQRSARDDARRIQKVLAQDPSNGSALGFGAVALAALGDGERAKEWIERALLMDPDNLTMRWNLVCALSRYLGGQGAALELLASFAERHSAGDGQISPARHRPRPAARRPAVRGDAWSPRRASWPGRAERPARGSRTASASERDRRDRGYVVLGPPAQFVADLGQQFGLGRAGGGVSSPRLSMRLAARTSRKMMKARIRKLISDGDELAPAEHRDAGLLESRHSLTGCP